MHRTEMLVLRLYADDFLGYLDSVAVFRIKTGDECIRIACFHHHHTEVVAFEHLVVGFFVGGTLAGTLFRKDAGITFAARCLVRMAQVYDFDTFQAEVEFLCQFLNGLVVT